MTTIALALHLLAALVWVGGMFFAIMVLRLAAGELEPPVRVPLWGRVFSKFFPWVWMAVIVLPLTGWLMISAAAERRPFNWYGLFGLPYLPVQGNKALGGFSHEAHEVLGYVMIALIVLHVAAALKHHFADRTRLIARMWP